MSGGLIQAIIENDYISSFTILNGGSGYTSPPIIFVEAPKNGGTQCQATSVISNGIITDIIITEQGSGYASDEVPLCLVFDSFAEGIIQHQGWLENVSDSVDDKYKLIGAYHLKTLLENLLKKDTITIASNQSDIFAFTENGNIIITTDKLNGYAHGFSNSTEPPTLYTHSLISNFIGFKQNDINYILIENNSNEEIIFTIKIFQ